MSDDFDEKTKDLIRKECGFLCCKCRCHTIIGNGVNIGDVAHIKAASPGGPRYDSNQTSLERKSQDNGLLLCKTCHKEVDDEKNIKKYTERYLHSIKDRTIKFYKKRSKKKEMIKDSFLQKLFTPFVEKNYLKPLNEMKSKILSLDFELLEKYANKFDEDSAPCYLWGYLCTQGNEMILEELNKKITTIAENWNSAYNYVIAHKTTVRSTYFEKIRQISSLFVFTYDTGFGINTYAEAYALCIYRNKDTFLELVDYIID